MNFFDEQREQSKIKTAIVTKYFDAWANVMIRQARKRGESLAYIDLFAGPGEYADGEPSTPLLILPKAVENDNLREHLLTVFNDSDRQSCDSLSKKIESIPGIEKLSHTPQVLNLEVGTEIAARLESLRLPPTLLFADPWGYKGLSIRLIWSVLKNWGCDAIFFFNYNRINPGLNNLAVQQHMDDLFGPERAAKLRTLLPQLSPEQRELAIVEEIGQALQDKGVRFVLPFRFRKPSGERTSHHLIFASKHQLGYAIMKDIMARESSGEEQGVPTFEYNPAYGKQGLLFELARPLDDLEEMLLVEYAGQTKTMKQIYEHHNIGRRFIKKNYKEVLLKMEMAGTVRCNKPYQKRQKRKGGVPTFGDTVVVQFPKGE